MSEDATDSAIVAALAEPTNDQRISDIVALGQEAYDRIVTRIYKCPGVTHPQEGDDKMCNLLVRIAAVDPSIVTKNMTHPDSLARSRVVSAAMVAGRHEFSDLIIDRLLDRSIYVLDKVVWAIDRHPRLRTSKAAELLKALLERKVARRLCVPIDRINELVAEIEFKNKKAERADALNHHACGTFGTSAAEIVYYLPPNI